MKGRKQNLQQGMVQIYTGSGKGKTTASLGLALRAVGHNFQVFILQFMKGSPVYGEIVASRRLAPNLTVEQVGRDAFVSRTHPDPEDVRLAQTGFEKARKIVLSGKYDLVVLDEINCAVDFGLLPLEEVCNLVRSKPVHTELVLTGRGAPQELVELADLVTEMREIKHYFNSGQHARRGIES